MSDLVKVTSHDTANAFFWWLSDHTEIDGLQGFNVVRLADGRVSALVFGSTCHNFDIDYIYRERKMLNDWIDAQLQAPPVCELCGGEADPTIGARFERNLCAMCAECHICLCDTCGATIDIDDAPAQVNPAGPTWPAVVISTGREWVGEALLQVVSGAASRGHGCR